MIEENASLLERRRHPRTQLNISLNCIRLEPDGGDVLDRIDVVDVSRRGMGAISQRAYYPGQRMLLCLPLTEDSGKRNIYASVIRCRPMEDGYEIGLEFDSDAVGAAYGRASTVAVAA